MKIYQEISMDEFNPWSGAVDTYKAIDDAGKMDELTQYLEDMFPDGAEESTINDILWFEGEELMSALGMGLCCECCGEFGEEVEEREDGRTLCADCWDEEKEEEK